MANRPHPKNQDVFLGGYDVTNDTISVGSYGAEIEVSKQVTFGSVVFAILGGMGHAVPSIDGINGLLDATATTGFHTLTETLLNTVQPVTVAYGTAGAVAAGDPAFSHEFNITGKLAELSIPSAVAANLVFNPPSDNVTSEAMEYGNPFGHILHASAAATAVNSATSATGGHDNLASTALGGYGFLHILAGNGSATFSIEHSATDTDGAFDSAGDIITFDTTDATTRAGETKVTATTTTTINRYTRWQVALGTATTVTFVMGIVRGVV